MKNAETKYFEIAVENRQLYHNLGGNGIAIPLSPTAIGPWFNPWSKITKGNERFQRIGDRITPRGMSIRLWYAHKSDRPNVKMRIIVAVLPKEVNGLVTTEAFDPFQIANSGSNGNNLIWHADADIGVKFLYDKIHVPPAQQVGSTSGANGKEYTKFVKIWIRRKKSRDVVFNTSAQAILNKPLAIFMIPYEQYSTLTTDNVASMAGTLRMYYKDI